MPNQPLPWIHSRINFTWDFSVIGFFSCFICLSVAGIPRNFTICTSFAERLSTPSNCRTNLMKLKTGRNSLRPATEASSFVYVRAVLVSMVGLIFTSMLICGVCSYVFCHKKHLSKMPENFPPFSCAAVPCCLVCSDFAPQVEFAELSPNPQQLGPLGLFASPSCQPSRPFFTRFCFLNRFTAVG